MNAQTFASLEAEKQELIKKFDILKAKFQKKYSSVNIESPVSDEEKADKEELNKIASRMNQIVIQKRMMLKVSTL
jgi:hypothetical protein